MTVSERDLVGYAAADTNGGDDDDYANDIMRMSEDGTVSWEAIGDEYIRERRREQDLIDRNGKDTWLAEVDEGDEGSMVDDYLAALQGQRHSSSHYPKY